MRVRHKETTERRRQRMMEAEQFDVYDQLAAIWEILGEMTQEQDKSGKMGEALEKARRIAEKTKKGME